MLIRTANRITIEKKESKRLQETLDLQGEFNIPPSEDDTSDLEKGEQNKQSE